MIECFLQAIVSLSSSANDFAKFMHEHLLTIAMNETITSFIFSILSGLYAGLIVARYQRFADLRLQAKKVILEIYYIHQDSKMTFPKRKSVPEFVIIASDLFFLKHKKAGIAINQLSTEIYSTINEAETGKMDCETFKKCYQSWQDSINNISPSLLQIIRLRGGL
jgi:hypothetical protein